jgi:hypothetical protein
MESLGAEMEEDAYAMQCQVMSWRLPVSTYIAGTLDGIPSGVISLNPHIRCHANRCTATNTT